MPLVESRYAEALIDISAQRNAVEAFQQELRWIVSVFNGYSDLKSFILSPEVDISVKKELIKNIFNGRVRVELVNFLMLLLDKGRVKYLPGILEEFDRLADERKNVLSMKIISAVPIEDWQIDRIKERYRDIYNAVSVKADTEIDRSLTGGVKVKIGDKVYDGTVKGRLEGLKQLIVES